MEFDFDKELKACEKKKKEDEVIAYTVGVGRIVPLPKDSRRLRKDIKRALDTIQKMEGFLGIMPMDIWKNLILFDSLNHAKICRNILTSEGVSTGTYICPVLVEKKYLKG